MVAPLKTGPWNLTDLKDVPKNGLKVFSCFHCGGGSTMGYKLAGYDVLGGVEIDQEMMKIYRENHRPKHSYLMGVQKFRDIPDSELPPELFDLDILDGSPPCSSFSMAGSREKAWGEKKKFREGQAEQVLDDLFFDYIAIAKKLQPKVVVAENVKGLIQGAARGYVKEIFAAFREAGYSCQLFLLNAAAMGVPQKRERTFFIANRLGKKIDLNFDEKQITVADSWKDLKNQTAKNLGQETKQLKYWKISKHGESFQLVSKSGWFSHKKIVRTQPCWTVTARAPTEMYHDIEPRMLSKLEVSRLQSFADDYNFNTQQPGYVCGMSVPPFMMQRVADQIERQLLNGR